MLGKNPDSGNELTAWHIEIEDFDSGDIFNGKFILGDAGSIGTWRYKYVGNWETDNKNGWQPEYQVNETPMTANQLAALNSGVTKEKLNTFITSESLDSKLEDLTPKLDYEQIYTFDENLIALKTNKSQYWVANTPEPSISFDNDESGKLREAIFIIDTSSYMPSYIDWNFNVHAKNDLDVEVGKNVYFI